MIELNGTTPSSLSEPTMERSGHAERLIEPKIFPSLLSQPSIMGL